MSQQLINSVKNQESNKMIDWICRVVIRRKTIRQEIEFTRTLLMLYISVFFPVQKKLYLSLEIQKHFMLESFTPVFLLLK